MVYIVSLEPGKELSVVLLKNVKNVPEIREMVLGGSLKCCILKPSLIVDPFQVAVAAKKAVTNEKQNKMATKGLYTEILFNLSLSKNITQSLIKFGVSNTDSDVILCVVSENAQELEKVLSHFQYEECPDQNFSPDESLIRKEYKIAEAETEVSSLLQSVVSRIAAKDFDIKFVAY